MTPIEPADWKRRLSSRYPSAARSVISATLGSGAACSPTRRHHTDAASGTRRAIVGNLRRGRRAVRVVAPRASEREEPRREECVSSCFGVHLFRNLFPRRSDPHIRVQLEKGPDRGGNQARSRFPTRRTTCTCTSACACPHACPCPCPMSHVTMCMHMTFTCACHNMSYMCMHMSHVHAPLATFNAKVTAARSSAAVAGIDRHRGRLRGRTRGTSWRRSRCSRPAPRA